ncbi:MAG: MerR family transcriptional regulator [Kouleothrix sp.]
MIDEPQYTIGELAELAGVTPRTIRYYTTERLLPRPDMRGQYALYGAEHLARLQLIARLKASFLPLNEIRTQIENLSLAQIHALLGQSAISHRRRSTAAEYIAQLLDRRPGQVSRLAEAPAPYQLSPGGLLPGAPAPAAQMLASSLAEPAAPPGPAHMRGRSLAPAEPAAHRIRCARAAGEQWRRVVLAPGVELHLRGAAWQRAARTGGPAAMHARELFDHEQQ